MEPLLLVSFSGSETLILSPMSYGPVFGFRIHEASHQEEEAKQGKQRITRYLRRTRINNRPSKYFEEAFPIMKANPIMKELILKNIPSGSKPTI